MTKKQKLAMCAGLVLATVLSQGAYAASGNYDRSSVQQGPYHQDVLRNGTLTGPLQPDAVGN
jgi:hypothetical protein